MENVRYSMVNFVYLNGYYIAHLVMAAVRFIIKFGYSVVNFVYLNGYYIAHLVMAAVKYLRESIFHQHFAITSDQSMPQLNSTNMDASNDLTIENIERKMAYLGKCVENLGDPTQTCHICGSNAPTLYCKIPYCNNFFCSSCDTLYHNHPLRQSHVRVAISTKNSITTEGTSNMAEATIKKRAPQMGINKTTQKVLDEPSRFSDTTTFLTKRNANENTTHVNNTATPWAKLYDSYWASSSSAIGTPEVKNDSTINESKNYLETGAELYSKYWDTNHSTNKTPKVNETSIPSKTNFYQVRGDIQREAITKSPKEHVKIGRKKNSKIQDDAIPVKNTVNKTEQRVEDELDNISADGEITTLTILNTTQGLEEENPSGTSENIDQKSPKQTMNKGDTRATESQKLRLHHNDNNEEIILPNPQNEIVNTVLRGAEISDHASSTVSQNETADSSNTWICSHCNMGNDIRMFICHLCRKSKPKTLVKEDLNTDDGNIPPERNFVSPLIHVVKLRVPESDATAAACMSTVEHPVVPVNNLRNYDPLNLFRKDRTLRSLIRRVRINNNEILHPTQIEPIIAVNRSDVPVTSGAITTSIKSTSSTWACHYCTFVNESSVNICLVCSKTNIASIKTQKDIKRRSG